MKTQGLSELITAELLIELKAIFPMAWNGVHGFGHWRRVRENGLRLAGIHAANLKVVEYFAFFHESQRQNDHHDPDHGPRASELIRSRFAGKLNLTPGETELLCKACDGHTRGRTAADITVQTCWDSDRLDLWRVGIKPNPYYLCTNEAKQAEVIAWAVERSSKWMDEWGLAEGE